MWLILAKFLSYLGFSVLLARLVSRWVHGPAWSRLGLPWPALGLALLLLGAGLEVGATLHSLGFGLGDLADYLGSTRQGKAAIARVLGGLLVLSAEMTPALWVLNPLGALLVALGLGNAGHAAEQGLFWAALDSLHALAAAIWVGGLLALRTQRATAGEAHNFSRLATSCVVVLLLSGLAAALRHLPAGVWWQALTGSGWGLLLLSKLGLIALALGAAFIVRSRLLAAEGRVAQRTRRRQQEAPQARGWLAAETALLLLVLGLSGALSSSAPPAVAITQAQHEPISTTLGQQALTGQLDVSGRGEVNVSFSGAGPVSTNTPLTARLLMTDHPMPPQTLPLSCDDTHCEGHAQLWMSGGWVLELRRGHETARVPFRY